MVGHKTGASTGATPSWDSDMHVECGNLFQFSPYAMGGWNEHISADGCYLVHENCGIARASKMPWVVTLTATGVAPGDAPVPGTLAPVVRAMQSDRIER